MRFDFLLKKKNNDDEIEVLDPISETKNWYSDKYESILLQRNILFLIIILSLIIMFTGIIVIKSVASNKTIEPFVISIDEQTGITNVVNPLTRKDLTTNNALNNYFLVKFLKSRETYSQFEYEYNDNVIRLLAMKDVYNQYRQQLRNSSLSPISIYGANAHTSLKVRSLIYTIPDQEIQVRFTIVDSTTNKALRYRIANIGFTYNQMEMTEDERQINPLGFQIINYRVSDEVL